MVLGFKVLSGIGRLDQNPEKGLGSPDLIGVQLLCSFRIDGALDLANEGCSDKILGRNLAELFLEGVTN